jgi:hypothetical protein
MLLQVANKRMSQINIVKFERKVAILELVIMIAIKIILKNYLAKPPA